MSAKEPEITLRPMTLLDADAFAAWGLDADFCAAAEWTPSLPIETLQRCHRSNVEDPPEGMCRLAAIHGGTVVGYVDLHGTHAEERELGYIIGPSSRWGQRLGTAVARAGLRHGFHQMGLSRITAEALDANQASVKILQRLGMIEFGRGDDGRFRGEPTYYRQFLMERPTARP